MSYAALAGLFLLVPLVVLLLAAVLRRPGRRWWLTTAVTVGVLLVLTIVFDTLMIAATCWGSGSAWRRWRTWPGRWPPGCCCPLCGCC